VLLVAGQASGYSSGSPGDGGSSSRNQRYASGEILVTYKDGASPARRAKVEKALGNPRAIESLGDKANNAVYLYKLPPGLTVERAVGKLKGGDGIIAEPNHIFSLTFIPNDPHFPNQWGLRNTGQVIGGVAGTPGADINAVEAWDIERGLSNQVVVAVIDSGIDLAHPDLQGRIWQNPGEIPNNGLDDDGNGYVDDVFGWNFVHNNKTPADDNGHGTHVSGIVTAATDNGLGIAGTSHGALIMPLKAADSAGSLSLSNVIKAIDYAADNGADIINMSFAAALSPPSTALGSAIDQAHAKGLTLLAAVGNEGDGTINYPAGYDNVIGVGATTNRDEKASFSNHNSTVDIVAPGQTIYSTFPGGYAFLSGTSMATPMAAGVAALALSRQPGLAPVQVKSALTAQADDLGAPGRDDYFGYGRVNARRALLPLTTLVTSPAAPNGDNGWFRTIPTITLMADRPGATVYYRWGSDSWRAYSGSFKALAGQNTLSYYSTDGVEAEPVRKQLFKVDTVKPSASLKAPKISTNVSKTRTFKVSWKGTDPLPRSGIASYRVQRRAGPKGKWKNWKSNITVRSAKFKGRPGRNYYFRVKAKDKAGNVSAWSKVKRTIVPYDNNSLISYRIGFNGTVNKRSSGYYLGTVRYSVKSGHKITYKFKGKRVALIGTKAPKRSKANIYINGDYIKTIDAYSSKRRYRKVLYSKTWKKSRTRTITIENLATPDRPRFDIDGLAVGR
jgi:subtilisin family serine protease